MLPLQNATAGPHFVTQPILLSENIPTWHKSSTKHKEAGPDWNDKNDNANYALHHMEGFTIGSGLPFLKKYSIMRKDLDPEFVYLELFVTIALHYIYYFSHR